MIALLARACVRASTALDGSCMFNVQRRAAQGPTCCWSLGRAPRPLLEEGVGFGVLGLSNFTKIFFFYVRIGESWNCVVGKNFGSHVIHQTEGYLFCSYRDEISILLWKSG